MTLTVTGVFFLDEARFHGAETHPSAGPPHRLGLGERARKHPLSSGPMSAPGAPTPPAAAHHRPPGATRGCDAGSAGSLPWEDLACGTVAKPLTRPNSAGAVFRPGWRRSSRGLPGNQARTARGIHSEAYDVRPEQRARTPALSHLVASPISYP